MISNRRNEQFKLIKIPRMNRTYITFTNFFPQWNIAKYLWTTK